MKYSFGISNFLEEISSLSYSVIFLYFFALIAEEGFLISLLFFGNLSSVYLSSVYLSSVHEWPRRANPCPRSGAAAEISYPMSKEKGGSQEELPHARGADAAWAQEGREELLHVQGQEGWP